MFVVMTCDLGSRESGPGFWPLAVALFCIPGWSDQPVPTCTGSLQERHLTESARPCVSVTDLAPSDPVRVGPGFTSMGQPPLPVLHPSVRETPDVGPALTARYAAPASGCTWRWASLVARRLRGSCPTRAESDPMRPPSPLDSWPGYAQGAAQGPGVSREEMNQKVRPSTER